ncbi:hypothetical protein C0989_011201 [Termitomyces sp. Mn162]|nr:hypothetical protein C0989_011201 [Termitomyces sp. Mn162]
MHLRTPFVSVSFIALLLPSATAEILFRGRNKAYTRDSSDARHNVIVGRQIRVKPDNESCVSISGIVYAETVNLVPDPMFENLTVAVCKKDIEKWLASDPNGIALVGMIGIDAARMSLFILFSGTPTAEKQSVATPYNISEREEPSRVRRDKGVPSPSQRARRNGRQSLPIITLAQAKQTCKVSESVCGVPGREDEVLAFECINTRTSLDNCMFRGH